MANQTIDLSRAFAALGDPTRRALFERLGRKALAVNKLAEGFSVSRSAVSQHLKVLKEAGLVRHEADGARGVYRIDPRGLEKMRGFLDKFWERALHAFKAAAEAEEP